MKIACIFISNNSRYFLFHVNETWDRNFLYTVDSTRAIYITTAIRPCMVALETPIDAQRKIIVLREFICWARKCWQVLYIPTLSN